MNKIKYITICFAALFSWSEDNDYVLQTLAMYTQGRVLEMGTVIACAATHKDTGEILAFYYLKSTASDIRYYETNNAQVDETDFTNYTRNSLNVEPFLTGI